MMQPTNCLRLLACGETMNYLILQTIPSCGRPECRMLGTNWPMRSPRCRNARRRPPMARHKPSGHLETIVTEPERARLARYRLRPGAKDPGLQIGPPPGLPPAPP